MGIEISILRADITTLDVDVIVNAANRSLLGGGGVDGAIHKAAGPELLEATKELGGAHTGEAKITKGFNLPAEYIIHTVGPIYQNGTKNEANLLAECYENSLLLADDKGLKTIAFSAISTGVYGYPLEEATEIAISTIRKLIPTLKHVEKIIFVVFNDEIKDIYETIYNEIIDKKWLRDMYAFNGNKSNYPF